MLAEHLRDPRASAEEAERASLLNPHDVFSRLWLGLCLRESGHERRARSELRALQKIHPTMRELRPLRAWLDAA